MEETKIKQGGHINTLQIRCALAGKIDPWESDILKEYAQDIDDIESALKADLTDSEFRAKVQEIIDR
jgi:hypothetical protein